MAPDPRSFTLTEAAAVSGVSRVTLRRWLDAGRFPSAFQQPPVGKAPATWLIPAADLIAQGLSLDSTGSSPRRRSDRSFEPDTYGSRLAVAEALAEERLRTIESLNRQLVEMRTLLAAALGVDPERGA